MAIRWLGLPLKGETWLLAVQLADAYVSADWYASGEQVPTWLYETMQLSGPVHAVTASHAVVHLDAVTAQFEATLALKSSWSSARLAPQRLDILLHGIVAIEMLVETIEGKFKLNQHKSDADHVAVANKLGRQDAFGARAVAARMVALRPHLLYEGLRAVSAHDSGVSLGGGV